MFEKRNNKIGLDDTGTDVLFKLSEGNPGALRVCCEILDKASVIDPDAFGGGLFTLLSFDTLNIYGSKIWMLYKDVCKCDLISTLGLLRGWQFGILTETALKHAIDNYGDGIDVQSIVNQVKERLPAFGNTLSDDIDDKGDE